MEFGNLNTQHDGQISQQEPEYDESVPDDSPRLWDDSARLDDNVSVDAPLMLDHGTGVGGSGGECAITREGGDGHGPFRPGPAGNPFRTPAQPRLDPGKRGVVPM